MGKTNAYSGYGGQIKIGTSVVAEVTEWNGTFNHETTDVTRLSSSGWTDRVDTRKDFTGSFNTNVLVSGVAMLTSAKARNAEFFLSSSSSVSASKPKFKFRMFHSTDITVPAGQVTFAHTFESDGPVGTSIAPL